MVLKVSAEVLIYVNLLALCTTHLIKIIHV
jgi:hypothetical protein